MTERMLDVPPVGAARMSAAANTTDRWLVEMGLTDSDDPDVLMLREASVDLDELNSATLHLSPKDLVSARKAVRQTITVARKAVQRLVDERNTHKVMERHAVHFSGLAARTLGWIDPAMLTDDLRAACGAHLKAHYNIDLADYEPRPMPV